MRQSRSYGSVRGAVSNGRPYRDPVSPTIVFQHSTQVSGPTQRRHLSIVLEPIIPFTVILDISNLLSGSNSLVSPGMLTVLPQHFQLFLHKSESMLDQAR